MRFLSHEWVSALDRAAAGWAAPPELSLTIEQVVTGRPGAPGPADAYHLCFAAGRLEVRPGRAARADLTVTTAYDVAVGLSRGDGNAQQALAEGRLRVSGDVALLSRHARTFAALDDLFSDVRSGTAY